MTRLLHLSDLHFGKIREELVSPLIALAEETRPDLIVISGDLTQRARVSQFRAARAFLDRLPAPWLAVPGNHDTPLDNPAMRMLAPWDRFRRHITVDLAPVWRDETTRVTGLNSMSRITWMRGRVSRRIVGQITREMQHEPGRMSVAVLHHPLQRSPDERGSITYNAHKGLAALGTAGTDLVLSGHFHRTRVEPFQQQPAMLLVQAGTSLSSRRRGEENMANLIDLTPDRAAITQFGAGSAPRFDIRSEDVWRRDSRGWRTAP